MLIRVASQTFKLSSPYYPGQTLCLSQGEADALNTLRGERIRKKLEAQSKGQDLAKLASQLDEDFEFSPKRPYGGRGVREALGPFEKMLDQLAREHGLRGQEADSFKLLPHVRAEALRRIELEKKAAESALASLLGQF